MPARKCFTAVYPVDKTSCVLFLPDVFISSTLIICLLTAAADTLTFDYVTERGVLKTDLMRILKLYLYGGGEDAH